MLLDSLRFRQVEFMNRCQKIRLTQLLSLIYYTKLIKIAMVVAVRCRLDSSRLAHWSRSIAPERPPTCSLTWESWSRLSPEWHRDCPVAPGRRHAGRHARVPYSRRHWRASVAS